MLCQILLAVVPAIPGAVLPPGGPTLIVGFPVIGVSSLLRLAIRVGGSKGIGLAELFAGRSVPLMMRAVRVRSVCLGRRSGDQQNADCGNECLSHFHLPGLEGGRNDSAAVLMYEQRHSTCRIATDNAGGARVYARAYQMMRAMLPDRALDARR